MILENRSWITSNCATCATSAQAASTSWCWRVSVREAYVQSKEQDPESQLPAENIHLFFKENKILFMCQAEQQRDTVLQEEWLSGG